MKIKESGKNENLLTIIAWKSILDYMRNADAIIKTNINTERKKKIWKHCDGTNTATSIGKKMGNSQQYISKIISPWISNTILFEYKDGKRKLLFSIEHIQYSIFNSINWLNICDQHGQV